MESFSVCAYSFIVKIVQAIDNYVSLVVHTAHGDTILRILGINSIGTHGFVNV